MVSYRDFTLPETNSSHLKMDGWKTGFLLGRFIFYVSFRGGYFDDALKKDRDRFKILEPKSSIINLEDLDVKNMEGQTPKQEISCVLNDAF